MRGRKYLIFILLCLSPPLANSEARLCGPEVDAKVPRVDLFIDMDGVVIRKVKQREVGKKYVRSMGFVFEVISGSVGACEKLVEHPGIRLSFFSAASMQRNFEALMQIPITKPSLTLFDIISGGLFSEHHLTPNLVGGIDLDLKDLTHPKILEALPDFSLERALMVDDHDYLPESQRSNLLLVGNPQARGNISSLEVAAPVIIEAVERFQKGEKFLPALRSLTSGDR